MGVCVCVIGRFIFFFFSSRSSNFFFPFLFAYLKFSILFMDCVGRSRALAFVRLLLETTMFSDETRCFRDFDHFRGRKVVKAHSLQWHSHYKIISASPSLSPSLTLSAYHRICVSFSRYVRMTLRCMWNMSLQSEWRTVPAKRVVLPRPWFTLILAK